MLRLVILTGLLATSCLAMAEEFYLAHFEQTIARSAFADSTFFRDKSVVPGRILRDTNGGRDIEGTDSQLWKRDILYRGEELQPGTRIKSFRVRIVFGDSFVPQPNDKIFEFEIEGDRIRWPRNGLEMIRLDLPAEIYNEVIDLAQNGKPHSGMNLDVTVQTESGRIKNLYSSSDRTNSYHSLGTLLRDHFDRPHWLGMDASALKMFRGPRVAMALQRAKYIHRKCSEILDSRSRN